MASFRSGFAQINPAPKEPTGSPEQEQQAVCAQPQAPCQSSGEQAGVQHVAQPAMPENVTAYPVQQPATPQAAAPTMVPNYQTVPAQPAVAPAPAANGLQSVPAAPNQPPAAQRQPRQRTLKGAIASYNGGAIRLECIVRDLSAGGVKLKMQSDLILPDHFHLEIPSDGLSVDCQVRWRDGKTLGAVFLGPINIRENVQRQVINPTFDGGSQNSVLRRS